MAYKREHVKERFRPKPGKLFEQELAEGRADVYMPHALAKKYTGAGKSWIWQWVFPAKNCSRDPRTKKMRRHHIHETGLQKAVSNAAKGNHHNHLH